MSIEFRLELTSSVTIGALKGIPYLATSEGKLTVFAAVFIQNVLRSGRQRGVRRYPDSRWDGVHTSYFKYTAVIIIIVLTIIKLGTGNDFLRLAGMCHA